MDDAGNGTCRANAFGATGLSSLRESGEIQAAGLSSYIEECMASLDKHPGKAEFADARRRVSEHAYHTPLLTSRTLSEATGFDVRIKAENFQRTGSYKIRGPLRSEERRVG